MTSHFLTNILVIPENKTVILDLNGKTVVTAYEDEDAGKHYYAFDNKGTLTIKDTPGEGKIVARGNHNYGSLTLESGTIKACDGNGGYGIRNYSGSTFTMTGGSVVTTNEDDYKVDKGGYDATPIRVDTDAEAIISGGVVNNISDFTYALDNHGTTTINGGTFTSVHTTIGNKGQLTIDGGSFKCNGLEGVTAHVLYAAEGTATINGGTFDGKDNYNGFNVNASEGATVNINGGKFLSVHSGSLYGEGTITVTDGEFFDDPTSRLAVGYEAYREDLVWKVKVAENNAPGNSEESGTGGSETETTGTEEPETGDPGTDNPGTDNPEAENPETGGPETGGTEPDVPETENPGTENSGTDDPETDDPETENN